MASRPGLETSQPWPCPTRLTPDPVGRKWQREQHASHTAQACSTSRSVDLPELVSMRTVHLHGTPYQGLGYLHQTPPGSFCHQYRQSYGCGVVPVISWGRKLSGVEAGHRGRVRIKERQNELEQSTMRHSCENTIR